MSALREYVDKIKEEANSLDLACEAYEAAGDKPAHSFFKELRQGGQSIKLLGQSVRVEVSNVQKAKKANKAK